MTVSKLIDVKAENRLRQLSAVEMFYDAAASRGYNEHLWARYCCEASAFAATEAALLKMVKFCW